MTSTRTTPIDVDHDSDATLSSDSDVDMDRVNDVAAQPTHDARWQETATNGSATARVRDAMAPARATQRSAVLPAATGRASYGASVSVASSVSMANGKKRRLSSPPPVSRSPLEGKQRVSLDFRLEPPVARRADRSMQLIDTDEEEEESKSDPSENRNGARGSGESFPRSSSTMRSGMNRVESVRTWMCGRWFGKCVLDFHSVYVQISLYSLPTRQNTVECEFQGSVQTRQLERFSLSRGPSPYFAIMEMSRRFDFEPAFANFYDTIFARVTEREGPSIEPDLFGVVLFFDDDLELARCQSIGDMSTNLRSLLEKAIPVDESLQIRALKFDPKSSASPQRSSTSFFSRITDSVKGTIDTISNLFTPDRSPQKLRQSKIQLESADGSDQDSSAMSSRFRTSSRRKSLLQQSSRDAEVVIQLSGDPDPDSGAAASLDVGGERRSARVVMQSMQQQHRKETQRLTAERKAKLLLSYPFEEATRNGQITVTYGDIDRLKPGEFLNDSIIDFYLRYLWRHVEPWQQDLVYFFSSHFFTQLCGGKLSGSITLSEDRLRRVSRWTQKENLFEKRFIFVPINDSCHWSIAVLCNPGSAIIQKRRRPVSSDSDRKFNENVIIVDGAEEGVVDTTEDASDSEEEEILQQERMKNPPCLLFLDSLRCHQKKKICTLLKSYIEYEFKTRLAGQASEAGSSSTNMFYDLEAITIIEPEIPLQSNSSDCGVFLLMYTAQILQRFPAGLAQEDVASKLASSMSKQMFHDGHVQEFRDYLHQLIFMLQKIERRGGSETAIKTEGLEFFAVEN